MNNKSEEFDRAEKSTLLKPEEVWKTFNEYKKALEDKMKKTIEVKKYHEEKMKLAKELGIKSGRDEETMKGIKKESELDEQFKKNKNIEKTIEFLEKKFAKKMKEK